jgi:AcrR family transcriptional regulator
MAPEERRQAIIDATLPLLLERGTDMSTREIAQAAGIAEGTIFRAFETKQDLIHATIHTALMPDAAITHLTALPEGQTLSERVVAIIELLRDEIHRTRSLFAHFARPSTPPAAAAAPRAPFGGIRPPFNPHETKSRLNTAVSAALQPYSGELAVSTAFATNLLSALAFASSFTLTEGEPPISSEELSDVVLHGIAKGDS